jgi:hypothetical protein
MSNEYHEMWARAFKEYDRVISEMFSEQKARATTETPTTADIDIAPKHYKH